LAKAKNDLQKKRTDAKTRAKIILHGLLQSIQIHPARDIPKLGRTEGPNILRVRVTAPERPWWKKLEARTGCGAFSPS